MDPLKQFPADNVRSQRRRGVIGCRNRHGTRFDRRSMSRSREWGYFGKRGRSLEGADLI
jgi:hypothetical protein